MIVRAVEKSIALFLRLKYNFFACGFCRQIAMHGKFIY